MKIGYLQTAIFELPALLAFQDGGHFTIGKMERSLTPVGWAVLALLVFPALLLIAKAIRFLMRNRKLK